jgi:tRNA(adenine34) deaminase
MCAGASYWSQIQKVVIGTSDNKRGFSNIKEQILHPKTIVVNGILEEECKEIMQRFFQSKREDK